MTEAMRVLVTGAAGQVGVRLVHELRQCGYQPIGLGHSQSSAIDVAADIRDRAHVATALEDARPDAIIHAAAYTDVDGCERDQTLADAVNHLGSENIASLAAERNIWMLGIGTDFVFPGDGGAPYDEDAQTSPASVYGDSKLAGERAILAADPWFAVARTAWVYGGHGKHFPRTVLTMLARHGRMEVVDDEIGSPTYAADLATALVQLLGKRPAGVFHLTNEGSTSRFELARRVATDAGMDAGSISPISTPEFLKKYPLPARRPANSTLANKRAASLGVRLPSWEDAVRRYAPDLATEFVET
jgi:dTDP-4-dehydrorhamnose reductase